MIMTSMSRRFSSAAEHAISIKIADVRTLVVADVSLTPLFVCTGATGTATTIVSTVLALTVGGAAETYKTDPLAIALPASSLAPIVATVLTRTLRFTAPPGCAGGTVLAALAKTLFKRALALALLANPLVTWRSVFLRLANTLPIRRIAKIERTIVAIVAGYGVAILAEPLFRPTIPLSFAIITMLVAIPQIAIILIAMGQSTLLFTVAGIIV